MVDTSVKVGGKGEVIVLEKDLVNCYDSTLVRPYGFFDHTGSIERTGALGRAKLHTSKGGPIYSYGLINRRNTT